MKDKYNDTINEILSHEADSRMLTISEKIKEEEEKECSIRLSEQKIMRKIAKKFYLAFLPSKDNKIEIEGFEIIINDDYFALLCRHGTEYAKYGRHYNTEYSGVIVYDSKYLDYCYVDLKHVTIIKDLLMFIENSLIASMDISLQEKQYENDKKKSFLKLVMEKVSNW